ncbi:MAG: ATPase, T2SS/T4P/T4SS family, partial [Candidatus Norongarragalinales archaeon]
LLDESKCNSCGQCLKACPLHPKDKSIFKCLQCGEEAECLEGECPYDAIKCDLCASREVPACIEACERGALSLEEDALGWRVNKARRTPSEEEYVVASSDEFSAREQKFAALLIREFQEGVKEEKESNRLPSREAVKNKLHALLYRVCEENSLLMEKNKAKKIVEACTMNICGYGVLDKLLEDDELEEISVVGINRPIRVFHRRKGWLKTNCVLTNENYAVNAINKMARSLGRRITYQNPRLNATLPDGSRLHASISPVAANGVEITIRKFKENPLTVADLVNSNTLSCEAAAFLWTLLFTDASIIVAGNTGSGKTTTLNALFSFVPQNDRVVIVEETPEIRIPQKHSIRIVANEELGIQMKDLVRDTLRMRPDRVIIGEVRSREEVEALFDSLLSGQARGSYATFHAGNSAEAVKRLRSLGAREDELPAVSAFVVQRRIPLYEQGVQREIRRVTEVTEVNADGELGVLFSYNPTKDCLEKTKYYENCFLFEKMKTSYRMRKEQIAFLVQKKAKSLAELSARNLDHSSFAKEVARLA